MLHEQELKNRHKRSLVRQTKPPVPARKLDFDGTFRFPERALGNVG